MVVYFNHLVFLISSVCEVAPAILGGIAALFVMATIGLSVALCICGCSRRKRSSKDFMDNGDMRFECFNQRDGGTTLTLRNLSDSRKALCWLINIVNTLDQQAAENNKELCNQLKTILADLTEKKDRLVQVDSVEDDRNSNEELQASVSDMIEHIKTILPSE